MVDTHATHWLTVIHSALDQLDRELADLEATATTLRQELARPLPAVQLPLGNGQAAVISPAAQPATIAYPSAPPPTVHSPSTPIQPEVVPLSAALTPAEAISQPTMMLRSPSSEPVEPEPEAPPSDFDEHSPKLSEPAPLAVPHRARKPATRLAAWGTN